MEHRTAAGSRRGWRVPRAVLGVIVAAGLALAMSSAPAPAQTTTPPTAAYGAAPSEPATTVTTAPPSTAQVLGVQVTAAPAVAPAVGSNGEVSTVAFTGFSSGAVLRLGGALLVLGAVLVVVTRRRRNAHQA